MHAPMSAGERLITQTSKKMQCCWDINDTINTIKIMRVLKEARMTYCTNISQKEGEEEEEKNERQLLTEI